MVRFGSKNGHQKYTCSKKDWATYSYYGKYLGLIVNIIGRYLYDYVKSMRIIFNLVMIRYSHELQNHEGSASNLNLD